MYTQIGILMIILYFITDFFPKNTNIYYKKFLLFLLIFLFWWVGGLAYKLGVDNYHYESFYYLQENKTYEYFELGYKALSKIFYNLNLNFYIFKGILYFLLIVLVYKGIAKFFQNKRDIMLVFLLLFSYGLFYFFYISFIRQAIVISIFIYSLQYIMYKKKIKFFILITISYLFHKTAIILYLLYYLFNNKKIISLLNKNIILISVFLSKIVLMKSDFSEKLQFFISKISIFIPRLEYYLEYNYGDIINIYDILIVIFILMNKFFKIKYEKKELYLIKYFVIVYCMYTFFNNFSFIARFKLYIDFFLITNIVILINKCVLINRYNKIFKYIFIILFFMKFNVAVQHSLFSRALFPYQNYTYKLFKEIKFKDTQQFLIINKYRFPKIEEITKSK